MPPVDAGLDEELAAVAERDVGGAVDRDVRVLGTGVAESGRADVGEDVARLLHAVVGVAEHRVGAVDAAGDAGLAVELAPVAVRDVGHATEGDVRVLGTGVGVPGRAHVGEDVARLLHALVGVAEG